MNYNEFENEDFFEDEQDEMVQLKKQSEMLEQADAEKARQVEENYKLLSRNGVDWTVLPRNESDRLISTISVMIEWYIENGEQYEKCSKLNTIIKQLQN
jgi:hypothetical protein